jgi:ADP-ribose pyrophosphatase
MVKAQKKAVKRDTIRVGEIVFKEKKKTKTKQYIELRRKVILIVPIEKNYVYLLKEYRPLLGKIVWRVPAGTLHMNENPIKGAKRELLEETGLTANKMKFVKYYEFLGWVRFPIYIFRAEGLKKSEQHLEFYENIKLMKVSKKEAKKIALDKMVEPHHSFALLKCLE